MRRPLPLATLLYTVGVVIGRYIPGPLPWLYALSFAVALVAALSSRCCRFGLILLLPLCGWTNYCACTAVLSPADLRALLARQPEFVTLRGSIAEAPVGRKIERNGRLEGHTTAVLDVDALRRSDLWQPAHGRVVITTPDTLPPTFFTGRLVEITGVIGVPRRPIAPGQFDYGHYLRDLGIYFQLRTQGNRDWALVPSPPGANPPHPPWSDRFSAWAQHTLGQGLPVEDDALHLLWAMVIGWKPGLTQELAEPFMQSGTLHVFAISGLHIVLIAGILVAVLRVVRIKRGVCGWIVVPLIWFYTLATGGQASAVRSTIMMTIIIVGWALERPSDLINSLSAAACIILSWDPRQLFQAGFQLSFFVVLGLALLIPPFERFRCWLLRPDPLLPPELRPTWKRWLDPFMRVVTMNLGTSSAAWLGSMPLIAFYFQMITPGGLIANLIVVPLSSVALMSSLGSLICSGWCPALGVIFNHGSWFWMKLMIWASERCASLPGAYFYTPVPSALDFVAYYAVLGGALSGVFVSTRWRILALVVTSLLVAGCAVQWTIRRNGTELTILPLQGGAVFINAPGTTRDLLVDCGDARSAEAVLKPFLRSQGVNRIPFLLLSHGDIHHFGGTEVISSRFSIGKFVIGQSRPRSPAYRRLLGQLEQNATRCQRVQRGDQIQDWRVLHPCPEDAFTRAADGAVVLDSTFNGTRILLFPRCGRQGLNELLARERDLRADVLVIGPPAPPEMIPDALLAAVQPKVMILTGAEFPAMARPSAELRRRLAQQRVQVIYTSDKGAAIIRFKVGGFEVRTMAEERALRFVD